MKGLNSVEFSQAETKNYTYVSPLTLESSFPIVQTEEISEDTVEFTEDNFVHALQLASGRKTSEPES